MGPLQQQFEALSARFEGATLEPFPGGGHLVIVPGVSLPAGWSKNQTSIWFFLQAGYPFAQPDCFWADNDLRLADGRQPQNTGFQPTPNGRHPGLWFSWHLASWNPNRETLDNWMNAIIDRFRSVR